jgi:hypothetical protein
VLVAQKYAALAGHSRAVGQAGWNLLGDPFRQPGNFASNLLGWRTLQVVWLQQKVIAFFFDGAALLLGGLLVVGLVMLARRQRVGWLLLAWSAVVVAAHVAGYAEGRYYPAYKIVAHTYFLVPLALASLLLATSRSWRVVATASFAAWLAIAGACAFRFSRTVRSTGYSVSYAELRDCVAAHGQDRPVMALASHREPFWLLNLISGETRVPVAAVTSAQRKLLQDRGLGPVWDIDSHATSLRGLVLVDDGVVSRGGLVEEGLLLEFRCRQVLARIGGLTLCRGYVVLHTTEPSAGPEDRPLRTFELESP